ncbi:MAG: GNAT family N-acetyltransferase [Candidatus Zixiibacteriota bacterium]
MELSIHPVEEKDSTYVLEVFRGWGADFVVSRGRKVYPDDLEGFVARDESGRNVGLVTYEIDGDQCEIVTLDAFTKFSGIGTALVEAVKDRVKQTCKRLWLITTNDNLDAIRFYHHRGFTIAALYPGAIEKSRKLKPTIPMVGCYGIAIRDEIEFETMLD